MTKPLRQTLAVLSKILPSPTRILEIGSLQTKNQKRLANLRTLFPQSQFVGSDIRPGPGVDWVMDAQRLPLNDHSFDLVLCLEVLEHAQKPWEIAKEIARVVKPNGFIIISTQQNFPLHKHPSDYYRFTPYGLLYLFPDFGMKLCFAIAPPFNQEVKLNPQTVVLVASKKPCRKLFNQIKKSLQSNQTNISGHKPYRHRLEHGLKFIKRGLNEAFFRQEIYFFK